jgi:hypothetical protein
LFWIQHWLGPVFLARLRVEPAEQDIPDQQKEKEIEQARNAESIDKKRRKAIAAAEM